MPLSTVALSLAAAMLLAFGNQFSRLALRYTNSQTAVLYQIGVSTALYWITSPLYLETWYWTSPVLPLLALLGLFRPILSANLGMAGTRILGPTIAATLSATSPLFGVALGVMLLAEPLGWPVALGTAGIITAVVLLSWRHRQHRAWPLWALMLPVGAAFLRSLAHALAKIGLEAIPSPFFVALVAYSVSLPLALANDRRVRRNRAAIPPAGRFWLVMTGLTYGIAVLVLNTALLSGNLVVVSPIVACSPLFTMLLGYAVFREDTLDRRVALAVTLVVPSVILIATRG